MLGSIDSYDIGDHRELVIGASSHLCGEPSPSSALTAVDSLIAPRSMVPNALHRRWLAAKFSNRFQTWSGFGAHISTTSWCPSHHRFDAAMPPSRAHHHQVVRRRGSSPRACDARNPSARHTHAMAFSLSLSSKELSMTQSINHHKAHHTHIKLFHPTCTQLTRSRRPSPLTLRRLDPD